ncbi:hypothetical protein M407DRAFT_39636, partial [Tulasnella calospora MUT 4182]
QNIAACAKACLENTDPSPCKDTDTACLCVNPKYIKALSTCVESSCSQEDAKSAAAVGEAYCKAAVSRFIPSAL